MVRFVRTYYCCLNRDAANAYMSALNAAGYVRVFEPSSADFLLWDYVYRRENIEAMFVGKPIFVYPHTPYSWFVWDGICPHGRVDVNFVAGESAKKGLKSFGYANRIEVCGFPRCRVRPFTPTTGKKLLFAPAHPLNERRVFPMPENRAQHLLVMRWIVDNKHHFDEIRVRYGTDLSVYGFDEFKNESGIKFELAGELSVADSQASRDWADVIISTGTFGFLAVAQGKPTVMYGYKGVRYSTASGYAKNQHLYQHIFEFPKPYMEDMTAEQVLAFRDRENPAVEEWKRGHIGTDFDAEKFIGVIREFAR